MVMGGPPTKEGTRVYFGDRRSLQDTYKIMEFGDLSRLQFSTLLDFTRRKEVYCIELDAFFIYIRPV